VLQVIARKNKNPAVKMKIPILKMIAMTFK
jgi:hypothetical protein